MKYFTLFHSNILALKQSVFLIKKIWNKPISIFCSIFFKINILVFSRMWIRLSLYLIKDFWHKIFRITDLLHRITNCQLRITKFYFLKFSIWYNSFTLLYNRMTTSYNRVTSSYNISIFFNENLKNYLFYFLKNNFVITNLI